MPIPAPSPGYTTTLSVEEIATRVKRQFGDEAGAQINDADIIRWINDAQREIAVLNDLLQTSARSNLLAGENQYGITADVLVLRSVRVNGRKLALLSQSEEADFISDSDATGEPTHYSQWGLELTLYPTPQTGANDGLKIYYIRHPVSVAEVTDVPELPAQYHGRIVEYCIAQAHELDDNPESYKMKMEQFREGVNFLNGKTHDQQDVYSSISTSIADTSAGEAYPYG